MVVVAENSAVDIVDALRNAGAFPVVEAIWADAAAAVASIKPEALVLADRCVEPKLAEALAEQIEAGDGPFTPIIARTREDAAPALPDALPVAFNATAERIVRKVNAALRIRTLHATVMRRTRTLAYCRRSHCIDEQRPPPIGARQQDGRNDRCRFIRPNQRVKGKIEGSGGLGVN